MIQSFREFLSESKDYIKQIKDQIKKAKKDFPKSEFDQEKQVISFIKKLPKNIELDVKDPKLQKLGYDQTPYIHVGNGNFETKVNGRFNSVTAGKIYSFLNEDYKSLNESNKKDNKILNDWLKRAKHDIDESLNQIKEDLKRNIDFKNIIDQYHSLKRTILDYYIFKAIYSELKSSNKNYNDVYNEIQSYGLKVFGSNDHWDRQAFEEILYNQTSSFDD